MIVQEDELIQKMLGKWVEVFPDDECQPRKSRQYKLWFSALREMIYDYMGGECEEDFPTRFDPLDHLEASRWIFGDQQNDLSFDQLWHIFFDIDPALVKERLKLIFKRRKGIFNEVANPCRRQCATPSDYDPTRGRAGRDQGGSRIDNVLRSPDPQGGDQEDGG